MSKEFQILYLCGVDLTLTSPIGVHTAGGQNNVIFYMGDMIEYGMK